MYESIAFVFVKSEQVEIHVAFRARQIAVIECTPTTKLGCAIDMWLRFRSNRDSLRDCIRNDLMQISINRHKTKNNRRPILQAEESSRVGARSRRKKPRPFRAKLPICVCIGVAL